MKKLGIFLLILFVLLVAACGGGGKPQNKNVAGGASVSQSKAIVAVSDTDFTTMDPQDTIDSLTGGVLKLQMDALYSYDDQMHFYPMLATGYKANDKATEFTLTLRQGIKFSDGAAWNADAAIANIHKWQGFGGVKLKRTSLLSGIIKDVTKVDDYTIKIALKKPFGAFIVNLAHPACVMMSPKVIAKGNAECARHPAGTGQYTLVEWIPGDHLTVELNKDWWGYDAKICGGKALADKDAGFKTITFKPVPESATRVAMLQSGDAQFIWPVPTENMKSLKAVKNVTVGGGDGSGVRYLMMNNQKKPFNDVRVRQAIAYAIDKDAYIKVVFNGLGNVATSIVAPVVQFYKAHDPYPYDPEKAKALLKEAGYPNGFTTDIMYASNSANQKQVEFFKQQLSKVGITLELKGMENAILNQKVSGHRGPGAEAEVNLYSISWSPATVDADWGIRPLLASESIPPVSYNICYYNNPTLDKCIQQGLESADEKVRKDAYNKAQDIIWQDVPLVCLANRYNTWAVAKNITGFQLTAGGSISLINAKMQK